MRTLTTNEKAIVRRVALNVDVFIQKIDRIRRKIAELESEESAIIEVIESMEKPIVAMTGFRSSDFFSKESVEKDGRTSHEWKFENKEIDR